MIPTTPDHPCRWCGFTRQEHRGPGLCPVGRIALFCPEYRNDVEPQEYKPPEPSSPSEPARTPESIRAQWSRVAWTRKHSTKPRIAEALEEVRTRNRQRLTTEPNVSMNIRMKGAVK